jgi:hypothetical protein
MKCAERTISRECSNYLPRVAGAPRDRDITSFCTGKQRLDRTRQRHLEALIPAHIEQPHGAHYLKLELESTFDSGGAKKLDAHFDFWKVFVFEAQLQIKLHHA